jgi:hypothetical protein
VSYSGVVVYVLCGAAAKGMCVALCVVSDRQMLIISIAVTNPHIRTTMTTMTMAASVILQRALEHGYAIVLAS